MATNSKIKAGQTINDIAIQQCGTAESRFDIALLNGMGITDALTPGQQIATGGTVVFDVADYFRKYKLYPSSAATQTADLAPQGVEFWAVEFDFVVS